MVEASPILSRLAWHFTFWSSTVGVLSIVRHRLASSWDERERDTLAADSIVRHFEYSWEEGSLLKRTLLQDLHRKLDVLFPVEKLMLELESDFDGPTEEARARKLAIWKELNVEIISRMMVAIYSSTLLSQFLAVAMAIVGKALYRFALLKDIVNTSTEDISAANRIFVCIAARFVQHGTTILVESIKNSVKAIFNKVSLQEPTSRVLLNSLIVQVRHEVETVCGKNILVDCLFGRLDDMVGADLSSHRRRMFIGLVTEARKTIKSDPMKEILQEKIGREIGQVIESSTTSKPVPFLSIIPKIGKSFHHQFSLSPSLSSEFDLKLKSAAAAIFVDSDSDICDIFLRSISVN